MKFSRALLIGLFSLLLAVIPCIACENAEPAKEEPKPVETSSEHSPRQYVVSFHDDATNKDFDDVSQWVKDNKGEVVRGINENFAKLLIVKMDDSISKLTETHGTAIESIDEDELSWNDEADEEDDHFEL